MIIIHAQFPIDPNRREAALEVFQALVEASQAEANTIEYSAATDIQNPNLVRFTERYESEADLEAHGETDHVAEFREALPDLLDGQPHVMQFEVESATEMDL